MPSQSVASYVSARLRRTHCRSAGSSAGRGRRDTPSRSTRSPIFRIAVAAVDDIAFLARATAPVRRSAQHSFPLPSAFSSMPMNFSGIGGGGGGRPAPRLRPAAPAGTLAASPSCPLPPAASRSEPERIPGRRRRLVTRLRQRREPHRLGSATARRPSRLVLTAAGGASPAAAGAVAGALATPEVGPARDRDQQHHHADQQQAATFRGHRRAARSRWRGRASASAAPLRPALPRERRFR